MTESVLHLCLFCESAAQRLHVADLTRSAVDCERCGSYSISIVLDQRLRTFRNNHYLKKVRRQIERANARGNRLDVNTGLETPLDVTPE